MALWVRYTRHAYAQSMPDEKITRHEVEDCIKKAEFRGRIGEYKYKFRYRDLEVICERQPNYWLVITCYRI